MARSAEHGVAKSVLMAVHSRFSSTGGAEIQARALSHGLMQRGWNVSVVGLSDGTDPETQVVAGLRVSAIRVPQIPKIAGLLLMARFAWFLFRERAKYDVIHVHIMKTMAFVAGLLGKALGKTVVLKVSGIDELNQSTLRESHRNRIPSKILNWGCRKADYVIAISQRVAKRLEAFGYSDSQVVYLPNGVNVRRFDVAEETSFSGSSRTALFVGRLSPEKGLYDLLEAWILVRKAAPDAVLCIVGDGRLRLGLEAIVRVDPALQGAVQFAGESKRAEDFFSRADCYVCSSVEEGLSNTLLEAMASGLPIVSTLVSGAEDLIKQGINGYLVPVGRPVELAEAILRVFADPKKAKDMGKNSRRTALEVFDMDRVLNRYEQLYCAGKNVQKSSQ